MSARYRRIRSPRRLENCSGFRPEVRSCLRPFALRDEGALCFGPLGPTPRRDDRHTLLFVRTADTIIHPLAMIAVHTKHLESRRKSIALQPEVGMISSRISFPGQFTAVRGTIVIHVIERKKLRFLFAATSTHKATIVIDNLVPNFQPPLTVAFTEMLIAKFSPRSVLIPARTFHAARWTLGLTITITSLLVWRLQIEVLDRKYGWTYSALLRALARRCHIVTVYYSKTVTG